MSHSFVNCFSLPEHKGKVKWCYKWCWCCICGSVTVQRKSLSLTLSFSISLVLTKRTVPSITSPVVGFRLGIPLLGVIKTLRHISVGAHALILTPSFLAYKWLTSSQRPLDLRLLAFRLSDWHFVLQNYTLQKRKGGWDCFVFM